MHNCGIPSVGAASDYNSIVQTYLIRTLVQWYHEKFQLNPAQRNTCVSQQSITPAPLSSFDTQTNSIALGSTALKPAHKPKSTTGPRVLSSLAPLQHKHLNNAPSSAEFLTAAAVQYIYRKFYFT